MRALNRLNSYRTNAARLTETYKKNYGSTVVLDWRNNRYPRNPVLVKASLRHSEDGDKIFVDTFEEAGLTVIGDADDLVRLDHTGWYTDDDGDTDTGTLIPVVLAFRKPHELNPDEDNGHRFYLAGTRHSEWDGKTIYADTVYTTQSAAAWAADSEAESEAEDSREFYRKDRAEQDILEQRAEVHRLNQVAMPLIQEIKAAKHTFTPAICAALKDSIRDLLRERTKCFKEINSLTAKL